MDTKRWEKFVPKDRTNIVKLHPEQEQWEVAIDLDIPTHKVNDPAVQALLLTIATRVERAVVGDPSHVPC